MTRPRKVFWHLGEEIWTYADYPEKADLGNKPFDENRRFSDRLLPRLSRNRSIEITSFKHRRKVDRDNTVRFQLRTLQLLPAPERPSYAGATVEVLEGLDGQLKVRHEGRIIAAQEAPPSPVSLRNGHQPPAVSPVAPIGVNHWDERWTAHLAPLVSSQEPEADQPDCTDGEVAAAPPATVAPRKPTFLQRERWKAVQKARRKGMSLRAIERELGIHRSTVRSYLEAGGPPGWKQRMAPNPSTSDTMAA